MKLSDLEPQFVQLTRSELPCEKWSWHRVESLADADGVMFLDPKRFTENKGPAGTSSVICWFNGRDIPPALTPGPGRWTASGDSLETLTLSPSVDLGAGNWHGHITGGNVT